MLRLPGVMGETAPVHVAPMAGGPSTPRLVAAAASCGSFAQLAAGYRTPAALAADIAAVRDAGVERFGVNLFVPNAVPIDATAYAAYRRVLTADPRSRVTTPLPDRLEDDDAWAAKVDLLLADPVPVVSFTFGLPDAGTVARFRRRGTVTVQSVTNPVEAAAAEARGVDVLLVQGTAAGGHSAVLDPTRLPAERTLPDLVAEVSGRSTLPVVGAGGIGSAADVRRVLAAGASAAAVGTAVLRTDESGANAVHRAALADPVFTETAVTTAFTGRPARALVNAFVRAHADAPLGYPAVHHLTKPIRDAALAAGDPQSLHLWAGRAWRAAGSGPVAAALRALLP